jgi:hypothetical protein
MSRCEYSEMWTRSSCSYIIIGGGHASFSSRQAWHVSACRRDDAKSGGNRLHGRAKSGCLIHGFPPRLLNAVIRHHIISCTCLLMFVLCSAPCIASSSCDSGCHVFQLASSRKICSDGIQSSSTPIRTRFVPCPSQRKTVVRSHRLQLFLSQQFVRPITGKLVQKEKDGRKGPSVGRRCRLVYAAVFQRQDADGRIPMGASKLTATMAARPCAPSSLLR